MALSASASGTVATRAALDTLLGAGATNENFESYQLANGATANVGATLTSASTPNGQGPGLIAAGVTLSASNLLWQGNNFYSLPTKTMGADPGAVINIDFTAFVTTQSKSRLNFIELLNAGDTTHLVNDAATAYMREHGLPHGVIALLSGQPQKRFADRPAWTAHLNALGIAPLAVTPDPVRIATEGALWGNLVAPSDGRRGLIDGTVIVADGAGQFDVGSHALCWVHAERLVHKLEAFTKERRLAKEAIGARIWQLYADLEA